MISPVVDHTEDIAGTNSPKGRQIDVPKFLKKTRGVSNPFDFEDPACFYLPNNNGQRLAVAIYYHNQQSTDWVVAVHGTWSTRFNRMYQSLGAQSKMNFIAYDQLGHGDSDGDRANWGCGDYARDVDELRFVIEWIRSKGQSVKLLVGHSRGAACVNLYTIQYDDVPFVVSLSGRANFADFRLPAWINEEEFHGLLTGTIKEVPCRAAPPDGIPRVIRSEDMLSLRSVDLRPLSKIKRVKHYWILHGEDDRVVPASETAFLQTWINPDARPTIHVIEQGDHYLRSPKGGPKGFDLVLNYFKDEIFPEVDSS